MPSFNKVIFMGHLTRDPEMTYLPSGTPVTKFSIAMNERYNNSDGEQQEIVCFIDVEAWDKQAEVINEYLSKGDPIHFEGALRLDTWEDDTGKRTKHKIRLQRFTFVGGNQGENGSNAGGNASDSPVAEGSPDNASTEGGETVNDDVPF